MKTIDKDEQRRAHQRLLTMWERILWESRRDGAMQPPVFELGTNTRNWGYWDQATRTLSIHIKLATEDRFEADLEETMRHEIAHQWVSEVAAVHDEPPHGPAWKHACKIFNADPRATATCMLDELLPKQDLSPDDAKALRRIKRLLALSESSNAYEAELAALRARELMLKHHIKQLDHEACRFAFKTLGKPRKRRPTWYLDVANILNDHFQVQVIWLREYHREWDADPATPGFLLEVTGTPASVEIAEYVHDFLLAEGERLFTRYQAEIGDYSKPVRRKNRFLLGLYEGFSNRLQEQRDAMKTSDAETALIHVGEARLKAFFHSRYPQITYSSSSYTGQVDDAYTQGKAEGAQMSIRQGVDGPTHRGNLLSGD